MIAYHESLSTFYSHVNQNIIAHKVLEKLPFSVSPQEQRAFARSLPAFANALRNASLPLDVEVAIEYGIPPTNKRIDIMVGGADEEGIDHLVVCELKQWSKVTHTDMDDIVIVDKEEFVHPSWKAYTYETLIRNFNEFVEKDDLQIHSCAFLHNYERQYINELTNEVYKEGLQKAEPFISDQYTSLAEFVSKYIKKKSNKELFVEIEKGKIRPSKMLIDSFASMLNGNKEYELIDEQRIVFSNLKKEINKYKHDTKKHVFIIKGGAGTGKSVICISLLAEMIKQGLKAFYVAKSSYVRDNYFAKLVRGVPNHNFLKTLFVGSSAFINSTRNEIDVLIVDEAHRLTKETKQSYFYRGEDQIKEIINAAKVSVFFIDETQNIDIKDYGTIEHIIDAATYNKAQIHNDSKYELKAQFRCSGSDDYIAWLEAVLYNKPFAHSGNKVTYDIQIFDNLVEMKQAIVTRNNELDQPSRMLSGDIFEWKSRKNKQAIDIELGAFSAQWNKTQAFATDPRSIDEVGCIHTSQGMEFAYTGLIVGTDLFFKDGKIETDYTKHPKGAAEFKRPHQHSILPEDAEIIDKIIRNTYKVLFTRGQVGLYLYVMDKPLREYLKQKRKELLMIKD